MPLQQKEVPQWLDEEDLIHEILQLKSELKKLKSNNESLTESVEMLTNIMMVETGVEYEDLISDELPQELALLPSSHFKSYVETNQLYKYSEALDITGTVVRQLSNGNVMIRFLSPIDEHHPTIFLKSNDKGHMSLLIDDVPFSIPYQILIEKFLPSKGQQDISRFIHEIREYLVYYWSRRRQYYCVYNSTIDIPEHMRHSFCNYACTKISVHVPNSAVLEDGEFLLLYDLLDDLPHTIEYTNTKTSRINVDTQYLIDALIKKLKETNLEKLVTMWNIPETIAAPGGSDTTSESASSDDDESLFL